MNVENLKYINNGVAQDARMPKALHPDSVKIDGRSTINLVSFLGQYSNLLNYYKSEAEHLSLEGDWSWFSHHPIFRLAEIANTDLTESRANINLASDALQQKSTTDEKIYALRLLFDAVYHLLSLSNKWLGYREELTDSFADNLVKIVRNNLSPLLNQTRGYALIYEKHGNSSHYVYFDEKKLDTFSDTFWQKEDRHALLLRYSGSVSTSESIETVIQNTYAPVIEIARGILYNTTILITLAGEQFNNILRRRSDLRPDLGLLMAFLQLFRKAQHRLNTLSGKHLDFYYKDVLRFREASVVPDSTFLVMQLAPGCDEAVIPNGTAFDAGKDQAGNTIVFNAVRETGLNQVQVQDLRTTFIASTPLLLPADANGNPIPLITGIYSAVQTIPMAEGSPGFAVLGEDQFALPDSQQTMQEINPGFAVSSQALFLSGGTRKVTFTFHFSDNFSSQFQDFVLAVTKKTTLSKADTDSFFAKIFSNAFSVSCTGAKGWFDLNVTGLAYSLAAGNASISVTVSLDLTEQAVVAYNAKIHGATYNTPFPVFCFSVQPTYPYTAYNFLNSVGLNGISISCDVSGFKNISLRNPYSILDPSQPFQPLGINPDKGASLIIGSNEVFIKNTDEIDVSIDWQAMPSTGDFASYYNAYNASIANDSFRVSPSFLVNGSWIVSEKVQKDFSLYVEAPPAPGTGTVSANPVLSPTSVFKLSPLAGTFVNGNIDPSTVPTPPLYDQSSSQNGFLQLQLSAPQFGFGNSVYGNLYTNAILNNSKIQAETITTNSANATQQLTPVYATPLPVPNPPFTPVAKSIELRYTSTNYIDLSSAAKTVDGFDPFYHIDAFATYAVKPGKALTGTEESNNNSTTSILIVPSFTPGGNLYIGLNNVNAPEELTILLQLSEKALEASVAELPPIKWSYLANDQWKDFVPGSDMDDDTNGLIRSGIVTLDLHEEISSDNTSMPAGLCWIRAQASDQLEIFGNLTSIYTQVIEAIYNGANTQQRGAVVLPAASISKSITPIAQLKSIAQPFASSGGIAAESQSAFYTRVSERLRHKNRAIVPWDYERIALQNFQEIYKAKCIASSSQEPASFKNGTVELVVIPKVDAEETLTITDDEAGPVFGFTMLEEIKQCLQQYTSVHAKLTIRNPVYERLIVKCKVKFTEGSAFSLKKLNDAICSFLSPWINGNQIAYDIGSGIQKSTILAFVQQLPYVEFVTGFSVIKIAEINGTFYLYDSASKTNNPNTPQSIEDTVTTPPGDILYALTPYSVFASAKEHLLSEITEVQYIAPTPVGIGDIAIGNDFILVSDMATSPLSSNYYMI